MNPTDKKPDLFGRRSFLFRFGKGPARKLAARVGAPVEEVIAVSTNEITEHKKPALHAFLDRLAGQEKEGRK